MARGRGGARDGDLIGEGFTGSDPSLVGPFPSDRTNVSPTIDSMPRPLQPGGSGTTRGSYGIYNGQPLGDAEAQRARGLNVQHLFHPGAFSALNGAFRAAFRRR